MGATRRPPETLSARADDLRAGPQPVDRAGSSGVRLVTDAAELAEWHAAEGAPQEYLLEEFVAAVRAEPFDPAPGARIGAELVDLRMSAPPVIGTTVHLIAGRLPSVIGDDEPTRPSTGPERCCTSPRARSPTPGTTCTKTRIRSTRTASWRSPW